VNTLTIPLAMRLIPVTHGFNVTRFGVKDKEEDGEEEEEEKIQD